MYGRREKRGREATGWEPGLKGTGSGRFKPPCPPPLLRQLLFHQTDDTKSIFKERMNHNLTDFREEKRKNLKHRPDLFKLELISKQETVINDFCVL